MDAKINFIFNLEKPRNHSVQVQRNFNDTCDVINLPLNKGIGKN